ncbi:MAG TPA: hypothetical protein VJW20_07245 [Candidatus Angelobacter sp.]|nr:hypothetical protein [Candidatus Angelobacter sp.]
MASILISQPSPEKNENDNKAIQTRVLSAAEEKHSPWYRKAPILISLFALLVTITNAGWTYFTQYKKDLAQKHDNRLSQLYQLSVEIIDVDKQIKDGWANKSYIQGADLGALLNVKREVMISHAKSLINELGNDVPPEILYEIGEQEETDHEMQEAERLYLQAEKNGASGIVKISCMRSLGSIYMTPDTEITNLSRGRKAFHDLFTGELGNKTDYMSIYQRAVAYVALAKVEYKNKNVRQGNEAYDNAKREYESLPESDTNHINGIKSVIYQKRADFQQTPIASKLASGLMGKWKNVGGHPNFLMKATTQQLGMVIGTLQIGYSAPVDAAFVLEDENSAEIILRPRSQSEDSTSFARLYLNPDGTVIGGEILKTHDVIRLSRVQP